MEDIKNNIPVDAVADSTVHTDENIQYIELKKIRFNEDNPRQKYKEHELDELTESIRSVGLMQAVGVNDKGDYYQLIFGERRVLATGLAGLTHIKATVYKNIPEDEAYIRTVTENLQRLDITVIEEAKSFKEYMQKTGNSLEEASYMFGKKPEYIKSRLTLLTLIEPLQEMLEKGELSFGKAYELTKYSNDIQQRVYKNNFSEQAEHNWNSLTTAAFKRQMETCFTTNLDLFAFNKTECEQCPHNTANTMLFAEQANERRCTNKACLETKQANHLKGAIDYLKENKPAMEICVSPFDQLADGITEDLINSETKVYQVETEEYPSKPVKPVQDNFSTTESFDKAKLDYEVEMAEYQEEMEELEVKLEKGEIKQVFYIGDTRPRVCYCQTKETEVKDTETKEEKLRKIQESFIKTMTKQTIAIMKDAEFDTAELTEFDEDLLVYLMLPSISSTIFWHLGIENVPDKLTDQDMYDLLDQLNEIQKLKLKKYFLFSQLKDCQGKPKKTYLFLEFMKAKFPIPYKAVEQKNQETALKQVNALEANYTDQTNKQTPPLPKEETNYSHEETQSPDYPTADARQPVYAD